MLGNLLPCFCSPPGVSGENGSFYKDALGACLQSQKSGYANGWLQRREWIFAWLLNVDAIGSAAGSEVALGWLNAHCGPFRNRRCRACMVAQVTALQCLLTERPVTRDEADQPYSPLTVRTAVVMCRAGLGLSNSCADYAECY